MLSVQLCRLSGVVRSVMQVSLGGMRVMSRLFVVSRFVMFRGFAMMPGRVVVMLGCSVMVFCRLLGHVPSSEFCGWAGKA